MRETTYNHNSVQFIELGNWHEFVKVIDEVFADKYGYVFRGQSSHHWEIEPTLDRKLKLFTEEFSNITTYDFVKEMLLNDFKSNSRGMKASHSFAKDDLYWWELGQHHGLLTPLLDWSRSPFVAAFFAMSGAEIDGEHPCVWAIHKNSVKSKTENINPSELDIHFHDPISSSNQRLLRQQGLFSISKPLLNIPEWVEENFKDDDCITLYKFIIKNTDRAQALQFLNKMNINAFTLFPDLDGSAKHANEMVDMRLLQKIMQK